MKRNKRKKNVKSNTMKNIFGRILQNGRNHTITNYIQESFLPPQKKEGRHQTETKPMEQNQFGVCRDIKIL
jgi:hypothetical protein